MFLREKKGVFLGAFSFLDGVSEVKKNESLTAFFTLKGGEEFLKDHFSDFPVMPGVLQLESLKQAASKLLEETDGSRTPFRFWTIDSVKYGRFVAPGSRLRIFVRLLRQEGEISYFEGRIDFAPGDKAAGRTILADFTLVPAR